MRIVCPNCGEEPLKGQRHFCRPKQQAPRQQVELEFATPAARMPSPPAGALALWNGERQFVRKAAPPCATSAAICASVASLTSKNPSLWKSARVLARCEADDFVAGILASAVGVPGWHKDPKRALLKVVGQVSHEAAKAIQGFWRRRIQKLASNVPRRITGVVAGYQQLAKPSTNDRPVRVANGEGPSLNQRSASSSVRRLVQTGQNDLRTRPPALTLSSNSSTKTLGSACSAASTASSITSIQTATQSPRHPETPKNKSNPRPNIAKAVPLNPIQAMKQRKLQQQLEAEEKRLQLALDAEERRQTRGSSQPSSPVASNLPSSCLKRSSSASSTQHECREVSLAVVQTQQVLGTSSASRPPSFTAPPLLPCSEKRTAKVLDTLAGPVDSRQVAISDDARCQDMLTPMERRKLREANGPLESPRVSQAPCQGTPLAGQSPVAATARLRERLQQRDGNSRPSQSRSLSRPLEASIGSSWKDRIEARHREVEEHKGLEEEEKQRTAERSERRNDAMRRVIERQAQRQQDVISLEA